MTLSVSEFDEFVMLLRSHDWFYEWSDDHRVWVRGKEAERIIAERAKRDPILTDLYKSYSSEVHTPSGNVSYIEDLIKQKRKEIEECDD